MSRRRACVPSGVGAFALSAPLHCLAHIRARLVERVCAPSARRNFCFGGQIVMF